jgi:hypothetical protein
VLGGRALSILRGAKGDELSGGRVDARLHVTGRAVAGGDLVLQQQEAVDDRLGTRRAAGDVHVGRDDLVDARNGRVVVVEAARRRAGAEREDPLRVAHLLVDALEYRGRALADRADDPEKVGLARREARGLGAEAGHVEARAGERHELHPAARRDERVLEERVLARPAEDGLELGRDEPDLRALEDFRAAQFSHSSAPFFQQ